MLASVPLDWQVHDTFFVVAHFHYVLIGGAVFPLFGAMYYWFPKITGRMLSETLGQVNFWLFFFGFNLTFFPMHLLGLDGMTRRIYTYLPEMQWDGMNTLATFGAIPDGYWVSAVPVVNVAVSRRKGGIAGNNPWEAGTLEWATTSPPPTYNFLDLPTVGGREPLWEDPPDQPIVTGRSRRYSRGAGDEAPRRRSGPLDEVSRRRPFGRFSPPSLRRSCSSGRSSRLGRGLGRDSRWPSRSRDGSGRVSARRKSAEKRRNGRMPRRELNVADLPSVVFGHRSLIWWGTAGMMMIEGTVFAIVVATYFYLRTRSTDWPPGLMPPKLLAGTLNTALFLVSLVPNAWTKKVARAATCAEAQIGLSS